MKKAVALAPEATEIRLNYAIALARSGNKAEARGEVRRLIDAGKEVKLDEATEALLRGR